MHEIAMAALAGCCMVMAFFLALAAWLVLLGFALLGGVVVVCLRVALAILRKTAGVIEGAVSGLDGALNELDQYLVEKLGKLGLRIGGSHKRSTWNPFPLGLALISFAAVTLQELVQGSSSPRMLQFGFWFTGGFSVFLLLCLLLSVFLSKEKYPYLGSGRLVRSATDYGGITMYIAVVVLMRNLVRALSSTLSEVEPAHYRFAGHFVFYAGVSWIVLWFMVLVGRVKWIRIGLTLFQGAAGVVFLARHEFSVAAVYLVMAIFSYFSESLIQRMGERDIDTE
jgi:hypothetical protein